MCQLICFLVYSPQNSDNIAMSLGLADYSYYFVMQRFVPALQKIGVVLVVSDPLREVDPLHDLLGRLGFDVLFLSFTPPNKTALGLRCPTVPVFAWEYSTIPTESWGGDERHNWGLVLSRVRAAITHSVFAKTATTKALGNDYPVCVLPAPLWDLYQPAFHELSLTHWSLGFHGVVLDSHQLGLRETHDIAEPDLEKKLRYISLQGVVYAAVFNPNDGRKNWHDTLWAFCWAFRDNSDVTLLIKLVHHDAAFACGILLHEMKKLAPYQCRVVVIHGYLDDDTYRTMISRVTYIVNSSHGEGQCLPLMEFMSAGKPALAPNHSAMVDYIDESNAFVVRSSEEWTHWPHDPRLVLRTFRYRLDWQSLFDAFVASHRVALREPARYVAMSRAATSALQRHCSLAVIEAGLRDFLQELGIREPVAAPSYLVRAFAGLPGRLLRRLIRWRQS